MYDNGTVRPVETILRKGERSERRKMEELNPTKMYCKHFCKCYNVPPVQLIIG
jgi:hypothetical protein